MKQLIIIGPNSSSRMTVEKLGPLDTYAAVKTPYYYVNGDHSSLVCIYQGDSTRKYEFDGVVYDPKSTSDFMGLYSALKFYLLEVSLCGVL
jgi:hypothetical protein